MENFGPERQAPIEIENAAAANGAPPQRFDTGRHRFRRGQSVGIHEEQIFSPSLAGARISGRGNLAMIDRDHSDAMLPSDGRRPVGGSIIDNNDLEKFPARLGRLQKSRKRLPYQQLLVVSGDDEGDHSPNVLTPSRIPPGSSCIPLGPYRKPPWLPVVLGCGSFGRNDSSVLSSPASTYRWPSGTTRPSAC